MPPHRDAEIARRLRAGFEAFNRGNFDDAASMMHPDVEYIPVGGQPPLRGREAMRAWMEPSAWESHVIEPVEIDVFGSKVLMLTKTSARGAGSGIEMQVDAWSVLTVDDNLLLTRIETFFPHEEERARQAAAVADPGSSG